MQVTLEYAQEHFFEIAKIAQNGQEVEITRGDLPSVYLRLVDSKETELQKADM